MVSIFPKMLFLLLLLLMFLSPVRTQDTPKDVVYATLRYGGCKGNKPLGNDVLSEDYNEILAPTILILVMVDRKTKIIEYVQPLEFKFGKTHGSFMLHPVVGFKIVSYLFYYLLLAIVRFSAIFEHEKRINSGLYRD